MKIKYKKIARFMDTKDKKNTKDILGKNKSKALRKLITTIEKNKKTYTRWIVKATIEDIAEFYNLYKEEVVKKHNAKIYDILNTYTNKILSWEDIYYNYFKENNILLAGGIIAHKQLKKKETLVGCAKIGKDIKIENIGIMYLIEYLFFTFGLELKVQQFCAGKDRNCYWYKGENIWLAIHKLQNHYLPYQSSDPEEFEIDEKDITTETLILVPNTEKENVCDKAILRTNKSKKQIDEEYLLCTKRWISLEIRNLSKTQI